MFAVYAPALQVVRVFVVSIHTYAPTMFETNSSGLMVNLFLMRWRCDGAVARSLSEQAVSKIIVLLTRETSLAPALEQDFHGWCFHPRMLGLKRSLEGTLHSVAAGERHSFVRSC